MTENRSKSIENRQESGGKPLKSPKIGFGHFAWKVGRKKHLKEARCCMTPALIGVLEKLPGKRGVLGGVTGELLQRLPVALRSREAAVSATLPPALRVSPAVSPAVSWNGVWGRGCNEAESTRARHSVNEGFGKEFYGKVNSVKRSGPFSEPPKFDN